VATEVVHTLFGLTHQANAPPADRSYELRVMSSEFGTDKYLSQRRKVAEATPVLSDTGIGGSNPSSSATQESYQIKSERVRRLRDKLGV
jgi:hypothetical protein